MSKKKSPFDRIKDAASGVRIPGAEIAIPGVVTYSGPVNVWQIVVVGTIDVRQHGPHWYRMIDGIGDDELAQAMKSLVAIMVPTAPGMPHAASLIQFDVGAFAVSVTPDRWLIQTVAESNLPRIIEITAKVFVKLNEISIVAYGINKQWAAKLKKLSAKKFLADKLAQSDLALPAGDADGSVSYIRHFGDYDTMIQLSASPLGPEWLGVMYNRHHQIVAKAGVYFDLGEMVKANADKDWHSAAEYASQLAACVERAERD